MKELTKPNVAYLIRITLVQRDKINESNTIKQAIEA